MTGIIDVSAAIDTLGVDTVSVSRRTASYNTQGVIVQSAPTTFTATGSWQTLGASAGPAGGGRGGLAGSTGANVEQIASGQRQYGLAVFFTTTPLRAANPDTSQLSDDVTFDGITYTVAHVDPWIAGGYYRVVLAKKVV